MGTARSYDLSGPNGVHFTRFEWDTYDVLNDGTPVIYKNNTKTSSAPTLSNCHNTYAIANSRTKLINKIVCYDEQTHIIQAEIHWDHGHGVFKKDEIHVHINGHKETRLPTIKEIKLYEQAMEYNKRH